MTAKELCHGVMTSQQMSNIEREKQMLAADKFVMLLNRLNVTYDEFLFLLDNEHLSSKYILERKLAKYVKRRNVQQLQKLAEKSMNLFKEYDDIFFQHIELMSRAIIQLIHSNNDYQQAKKYLAPIKKYLTMVDAFGYYEIKLVGQCLFMFEIEEAISFGERAVDAIKKSQGTHQNSSDGCVLLTNMAIYMLDYEEYYSRALEYSQASINLATANSDATRSVNAQIIKQIAHFKLGDGLFNEQHLIALTDTFKLLDWHMEYERVLNFIKKHGISLT